MGELDRVEQVLGGNHEIFTAIVREHQASIFRLSLRYVKDVGLAEDVTQETFLKAFLNLQSFEGRSTFRSWLYQIAINTAKNKLRERRFNHANVDDLSFPVFSRVFSDIQNRSNEIRLRQMISTLPPKQRMAINLWVYEDLSFREIARLMDCPYDTAKANFRHGLSKLRKLMRDESHEALSA